MLNFVCDMSQEFPSIEPQIFRPQIIEVIKIGVVSKSAAQHELVLSNISTPQMLPLDWQIQRKNRDLPIPIERF